MPSVSPSYFILRPLGQARHIHITYVLHYLRLVFSNKAPLIWCSQIDERIYGHPVQPDQPD